MTVEEFNKKWEDRLEKGHYGLAISIDSVIEYLDRQFEELKEIPSFSYSQIKAKFGRARVYIDGISEDKVEDIELTIDKLLQDESRRHNVSN